MSPDWYSAAADGGNPSWNDSRWGNTAALGFAQTFSGAPAGYIIVFDRAAAELAVTVRVTMGTSELPDAMDVVTFGITANRSDGAAAHQATFMIAELDAGAGPVGIGYANADFSGSWRSSSPINPWIEQQNEWRGAQASDPSWIVSFRIKLSAAGVDPALPFRASVSVHIDGAPNDLSTPANLAASLDKPDTWPRIDLSAISCVGRANLSP
jgi:hypothetical protein